MTATRPALAGRHFVCAVAENVITDWKRLLAGYSETSDPFFVYGSNSAAFASYAQAETTLWVVLLRRAEHPVLAAKIRISGQSERGERIPQLDPKLETLIERFHCPQELVCSRGQRKATSGWRYVAYDAGSGSRFFPFNDATDAVLQTLFQLREPLYPRKRPKPKPPPAAWQAPFGSRLLGPALLREIADDENPFLQLERKIEGREVFVSYRHDASEPAMRLVQKLETLGVPFWFDRYALPVAEATERLEADEQTLAWVLDQGLHGSAWLVALAGASYGQPSECTRKLRDKTVQSWTLHEWETAERRILCDLDPAHRFANHSKPPPDRALRALDAEGAAAEIAQIVGGPP